MAIIPYSSVLDVVPLPIDAQGIVTNPVLVIAGTTAGTKPDVTLTEMADAADGIPVAITPAPLPVTYSNPAAEHATYAVSRAMGWPAGVNPWLAPEDLPAATEPTVTGGIVNAGSPSAVRDGDDLTYAGGTMGSDLWRLAYTSDRTTLVSRQFHGFRLRYSLPDAGVHGFIFSGYGTPGLLTVRQTSLHQEPGGTLEFSYNAYSAWGLPFTDEGEVREIVAVCPFDARGHPDNITRMLLGLGVSLPLTNTYQSVIQLDVEGQPGSELRIHQFYPLVIDTTLAAAAVARNTVVPASAPKRVTVSGYVAPDAEHTITGWPGGDFTGTVAQHQYDIDRTIIDFEQAGSPTGLPAEEIESARYRKASTDKAIATGTYNLVMGERQ